MLFMAKNGFGCRGNWLRETDMKESTFEMRLAVGDTAHFVEGGLLHLYSKGLEVAEIALVATVDGHPVEVTSWAKKNDEVIGHVRGNGSIHVAKHGKHVAYWVEGRYDVVQSAVYFSGSTVAAQEYHGFVSDWADRSFGISEDNEIVASTAVDPAIQGKEHPNQQSWMMAPSPRNIAFRSEQSWWGICIPGALPVGETHFCLRRTKPSVEFRHYTASNTSGNLPRAYFVLDLADPYDLLTADFELCRERRECTGHGRFHAWWARPIFCTWGEQCQAGNAWSTKDGPLTAGNVRRWAAIIREKTGVGDFSVIIDAPWFQKHGDFLADIPRFGGTDGLRALIDELHAIGHRVLLWFTPFKIAFDSEIATTEPDCLLLDEHGNRVQCDEKSGYRDYTSAVSRNTLINNLRYCLSPDSGCLDGDGMKIDFNFQSPNPLRSRPKNPRWGIGDEHWAKLLRHLHEDAHKIKPDCMITTSGVAPYLANFTDALRLNDLFDEDVTLWYKRARLGLKLMPQTLIDADGWLMTHKRYPACWFVSPVYAVPDVYHATRFDGGEAIEEADYRRLAAAWQVYLNAPISPDMEIVVSPETETFHRKYTKGPLEGRYSAISFQRCCLATFSEKCARVAAAQNVSITLPVPLKPLKLEAVHHDGRREELELKQTNLEVQLDVLDAASHVKYLELTF